jgi:hypothetical protein
MDEFALWVRLEDVYWSEEGRASIDASVIAIVMMGLIFLEVRPFAISSSTPVDVAATLEPPIVLSLVVLCFAKQRFFHGTIGFFIWPLAVCTAPCALASRSHPGRTGATPTGVSASKRKRRRGFGPDRRTERLKEAFRDAVGGTPAAVYEAKLAERARRRAPQAPSQTAEPSPRPEEISVEAREHGANPPGASRPQGDAGGKK